MMDVAIRICESGLESGFFSSDKMLAEVRNYFLTRFYTLSRNFSQCRNAKKSMDFSM